MPSTLGIVASTWTPAKLPDVLGWWDSDDASTFTYSSGTSVSQWNDKANGYNLVQSTGANQPSRSGTINGRSSVVFDGSSDWLSVASFDMTGGQQFSIAAVFSATSGSDQVLAEHTTDYNTTGGAWLFIRASSNGVSLGKRGGSNSYATFDSSVTVTTTPAVAVGTHDGTLSTNETSGWVNDDGAGVRVVNNNTNSNNLSATLFVGARAGTSLYLDGQIAELVITKSALSAANRERLQIYLGTRWGVTF